MKSIAQCWRSHVRAISTNAYTVIHTCTLRRNIFCAICLLRRLPKPAESDYFPPLKPRMCVLSASGMRNGLCLFWPRPQMRRPSGWSIALQVQWVASRLLALKFSSITSLRGASTACFCMQDTVLLNYERMVKQHYLYYILKSTQKKLWWYV